LQADSLNMAEAASVGTRGECQKISRTSSGLMCILTLGRLRRKRCNHGIRPSEIVNALKGPAGGQKNPPAFLFGSVNNNWKTRLKKEDSI
jgi:hypothetical protein